MGLLERLIHVPQGFACDVDQVAVCLAVQRLVAPKGLGILDFDQHNAAPSSAIRLVVRLDGQPLRVALVDRVELVAADRCGRTVDEVSQRVDGIGLEDAHSLGAV